MREGETEGGRERRRGGVGGDIEMLRAREREEREGERERDSTPQIVFTLVESAL